MAYLERAVSRTGSCPFKVGSPTPTEGLILNAHILIWLYLVMTIAKTIPPTLTVSLLVVRVITEVTSHNECFNLLRRSQLWYDKR